ncbi:MAG: DUF2064 domain-containing protein [Fimbriimonadaceae bacterium]|nr:DUF2064 domain-containing protein [Chitinophagales bacterium]
MTGEQQTAVLLFTRTVADEAAAKDFSGLHHQKANALIANKIISHSYKIISQSGLPFFIIDSAHQKGNTFSERFANAIEEVYKSGFENVIAIGNDCPGLTSADLLNTKKQLENNCSVTGPTKDGGLYLIGLEKKYFNFSSFTQLPWESDTIHDAFTIYLSEQSANFVSCTVKYDINDHADIHKLLKSFSASLKLRLYILSVIKSITKKLPVYKIIFRNTQLQFFSSLRAPPSIL